MFRFASGSVLLLTLFCATQALRAETLIAAPLPVRNLAPVSQLFGLPVMLGAERCCESLTATVRVAQVSNFTSAMFPEIQLRFDGETTLFEYQLRRAFGDRAEWGLVLPWLQHSSGFLDRSIDSFHNTFGLPEGGRDLAPRNQLDYRIASDGRSAVAFDSGRRGIGDVRGWFGLTLSDAPGRDLSVRAQLKVPTGSARRLTGSEGSDLALWVELDERELLAPLGLALSLGAGAAWLTDGELIADRQRQGAWFAHLGLRRSLLPRLALLAQLDAHSDLYDSRADALGGTALLGTLGFRVAPTPRINIDFSLMEDLISRSSADVAFQLQLHAAL